MLQKYYTITVPTIVAAIVLRNIARMK